MNTEQNPMQELFPETHSEPDALTIARKRLIEAEEALDGTTESVDRVRLARQNLAKVEREIWHP